MYQWQKRTSIPIEGCVHKSDTLNCILVADKHINTARMSSCDAPSNSIYDALRVISRHGNHAMLHGMMWHNVYSVCTCVGDRGIRL